MTDLEGSGTEGILSRRNPGSTSGRPLANPDIVAQNSYDLPRQLRIQFVLCLNSLS